MKVRRLMFHVQGPNSSSPHPAGQEGLTIFDSKHRQTAENAFVYCVQRPILTDLPAGSIIATQLDTANQAVDDYVDTGSGVGCGFYRTPTGQLIYPIRRHSWHYLTSPNAIGVDYVPASHRGVSLLRGYGWSLCAGPATYVFGHLGLAAEEILPAQLA